MTRNLSSVMVLMWVVCCACSSTYNPPSLINKLRVIGVRAEPPVVSVIGKTKLEPLVVGYDTQEPLCYAWSLCLFALSADGNFACLDPDLEMP
ncbi:MAG TPA: hypothetical protein DCQ06_04890, partial [Myxococcales bacterium]|nr:hypothetical protein [Myxococcales bacterium]